VTATSHGRRTTRIVDLDVPQMRPWMAALGPDPLPREGGWLMVIHAGRFQNGNEVQVDATGASVRRTGSSAEQLVFQVMPERSAGAVALEIAAPEGERRRLVATVAATPERTDPLLRMSALAGGFAAGGANAGPVLELGASIPLLRRLFAELAVGARYASLRRDVESLGPVRSSLLVFPVDAAIRFRAFQIDRFGLDLRGAVGMAPFRHTVSAAYQSPYAEAGIGFDSFGAAQGRYAFGGWELALELRAAFTTARTPRLTAFPGGFAALAGAGWAIP